MSLNNRVEWPGLGTLTQTDQYILFRACRPMIATGSAVWNGGSHCVQGWLNQKVSHLDQGVTESPALSLQGHARALGIEQPLTGMMTAASMNSMRFEVRGDEQTLLACVVTAGIQNARRSGDPCDQDHSHHQLTRCGTINIALIINCGFADAARIEALMVATEAKTAACYDLNILSPVSLLPATGTGTDSICLLHPDGAATVEYCGKHTRMGEWIGAATYAAVYQSLLACTRIRTQETNPCSTGSGLP